MYFCIQTYAIHFRDLIWNVSTFLTNNPVTQALIIPTMFVISFQPEWKFLGVKMGTIFFSYSVHTKYYVMQESDITCEKAGT